MKRSLEKSLMTDVTEIDLAKGVAFLYIKEKLGMNRSSKNCRPLQ